MRPPLQTPEASASGLTRSHVIGYVLAGAACIAYGASLILAKQVVEDTPPLLAATLGMTFGLLVLAVISAPDVRRDVGTRKTRLGVGGVGRLGRRQRHHPHVPGHLERSRSGGCAHPRDEPPDRHPLFPDLPPGHGTHHLASADRGPARSGRRHHHHPRPKHLAPAICRRHRRGNSPPFALSLSKGHTPP